MTINDFSGGMSVVIDEVGANMFRAYVLGAGHINGEGFSVSRAVGDMVLKNPLVFGVTRVESHVHYNYKQKMSSRQRAGRDVPAETHPDQQWLNLGNQE